jgi:hypothetical protein
MTLSAQSDSTSPLVPDINLDVMGTRAQWKDLGYCVPTKAKPADIEWYTVPGYRSVERERHLFSRAQVYAIDLATAEKRAASAAKALATRIANMEAAMETVDLTIVAGKTRDQIYDLAFATHGGNYQGRVGDFHWSNRAARNAIRHNLTSYERLWARINRGPTASEAYSILRRRVDELVDATYPQYAEGAPEVN